MKTYIWECSHTLVTDESMAESRLILGFPAEQCIIWNIVFSVQTSFVVPNSDVKFLP